MSNTNGYWNLGPGPNGGTFQTTTTATTTGPTPNYIGPAYTSLSFQTTGFQVIEPESEVCDKFIKNVDVDGDGDKDVDGDDAVDGDEDEVAGVDGDDDGDLCDICGHPEQDHPEAIERFLLYLRGKLSA